MRKRRDINVLMGGSDMVARQAQVARERTIGNGDLKPTDVWKVRRLMLSRTKVATSTEIVKREAKRILMGAADPEQEWYVQVAVYSGTVVAFMGEVRLPEDGDNPQDDLDNLIKLAHKRAAFLNTNMVELPGDRMIDETDYHKRR